MDYGEYLLKEAERTSETLEIIKRKLEMDRRSLVEITAATWIAANTRRIDSMGFPNLEIKPKPPLSVKVARLGVKILNVVLWVKNRIR